MSHPIHLRLCVSICGRNDFYLNRIRQTADSLGLNYTREKITDDGAVETAGLQEACLFAYRPGYRALHAQIAATILPPGFSPLWMPTERCCSGISQRTTAPCGAPWRR